MSLTSYRAAPPRVIRFLPKAKDRCVNPYGIYRGDVNAKRLHLLPEQIAEGDLSPVRDAGESFQCGLPRISVLTAKGPLLGGPWFRPGAVCFRE